MPNKTQNYQLNQYQPEDDFLRTDFNQDNTNIDAALTGIQTELNGKCRVVFGTYMGDGAASRTISIGFTPDVLFTCSQLGNVGSPANSQIVYGGLCAPGKPVGYDGSPIVEIVSGGFRLSYTDHYGRVNMPNVSYVYLAFRK